MLYVWEEKYTRPFGGQRDELCWRAIMMHKNPLASCVFQTGYNEENTNHARCFKERDLTQGIGFHRG
jgi:hypothetical protein